MTPQTRLSSIQVGQPMQSPAMFAQQRPLLGSAELSAAPMTFERNVEIFGEGETADYIYKVVSGSVRTYRVLNDGRRQIMAFYLPGDVFGIEPGTEHCSSAEAITKSVVLVVRRSSVFKCAERDSEVARNLWSITATEMQRSKNHALLLIKSAKERLASFLLDMAERLAGKNTLELPMSRQDIADYLGLTIETVSRTLTQLSEGSTIQFLASRRIVLRNRSLLTALNA
jgi:CRP-like cAMP-binding protein